MRHRQHLHSCPHTALENTHTHAHTQSHEVRSWNKPSSYFERKMPHVSVWLAKRKETRTHRGWEEAGEVNLPQVTGHGDHFLLRVVVVGYRRLVHFVLGCQKTRRRSLTKSNLESWKVLHPVEGVWVIGDVFYSHRIKLSSSVSPPAWFECRPQRRCHAQPAKIIPFKIKASQSNCILKRKPRIRPWLIMYLY